MNPAPAASERRTRIPGIVGGIGPESTIVYYRRLVEAYRARSDGHYPTLLLHSIDVTRVLELAGENRLDELAAFLLGAITVLADGGADFAALAANTPHLVFDALVERSPVPLVGIVEEARRVALARGFRRLALFGTRATMNAPFYAATFAAAGLEVVAPSAEEQALVHERYVGELLRGEVRAGTRRDLLEIARRMAVRDGTEAVILGGTELALILEEPECDGVPILDTASAHVEGILREMGVPAPGSHP